MSSERSNHAIRVSGLSKYYFIFDRPEDRLKQMLVPRLQRLVGATPKRYFKPFAAVQDVSFAVKRGETVGIIGRNGSGKSTLLQVVCGTLRPTEGTVDVNGRIAALLELGAGFNPEFTGRENVFVKASILGLSHAETEARFDDIARFADIGMFIDQPVKTYSSGMFVRLAFATAINVDPDILVVDEALAVGDEAFQRKCYSRIEEIKSKGATILFVSHGAQTIVQLCDRALLMDRGELILEGRPKTVVSQYQRLVSSPNAEAEAIREAIKSFDGWPPDPSVSPVSTTSTLPPDGALALARPAIVAKHQPPSPQFDQSWHDPSLKAHPKVEFESRGAQIVNARILNAQGKIVNVLNRGNAYTYEYEVAFDRECYDVTFGMGILTVRGFSLGGAHTIFAENGKLPIVRAGAAIKVSFNFRCLLLYGAYFLNSSVMGGVDGDAGYLHRVVDILAMRVAAEKRFDTAGGIIDFGIEMTVEELTLSRSS